MRSKQSPAFSLWSILLCFACIGGNAYAQCSDGTTVHVAIYSLTRTGGNTVTYDIGTETTGDYADQWQNYVDFSEKSPSSTVMHSNSGTWSSQGQEVYYSYNDQPSVYGAGTYTATSNHESYASCYGYTSYPGNPVNLSLTINQPTITVPGGGSGPYAWWYLGGYPAIDGYSITANFTGNANLGSCSGCSPTYNWQVIDKPGAGNPISFSSTNTTTPTLTSQQASSGGTYDISVVFTVDGFSSAKTWINLNTPVAIYVASTNQVSNPGGCSNPTVYGGYDYQVKYYIADLWNYAISPLTTNEKNDTYTDDTTIGANSWHYFSGWVDDDYWSPAYWNSDGWSFTDHIEAWNCSAGWTPPPVQPAGLNSKVQHTPQYWHTANQSSGVGIAIGSDTQTWYTDHGDRN